MNQIPIAHARMIIVAISTIPAASFQKLSGFFASSLAKILRKSKILAEKLIQDAVSTVSSTIITEDAHAVLGING